MKRLKPIWMLKSFEAFKKEWLKNGVQLMGKDVCTGVTTTFFEKLDKFVLTKYYEELYNYTLRIIEFINGLTIFFQDS